MLYIQDLSLLPILLFCPVQFRVCMCVLKYHLIQRFVFRFFNFIFNYVSVCGYVCVQVPHKGQRHWIPLTGVMGSWELPSAVRNHTPLLGLCGLLTAKLSLQPQRRMFIVTNHCKEYILVLSVLSEQGIPIYLAASTMIT